MMKFDKKAEKEYDAMERTLKTVGLTYYILCVDMYFYFKHVETIKE